MPHRYLYIWFRHISTDYMTRRRPALQNIPLLFCIQERNRKIVTMANRQAQEQGIYAGMVVADARLLVPTVEVMDEQPGLAEKILHQLALWSIQYTPVAATDGTDGLILQISGCAHLWGGERPYFKNIIQKLTALGYDVRGAIADTIGMAWAWARFGQNTPIIAPGQQQTALQTLAPAALRLEPDILLRLKKLGMRSIGQILGQPRQTLPPRFGASLLLRLDQALGRKEEPITPVVPIEPYQERLPCLEPIRTAGGIEIALTRLLESICQRLEQEGKGLRSAVFSAWRIDGDLQQISIGTTRGTHHATHLFKLFSEKIASFEPDLGFETFLLEAAGIEEVNPTQTGIWGGPCTVDSIRMAELLDRLANRAGAEIIHRYLPAEHHWPERAIRPAESLDDQPKTAWPAAHPRPIHQLPKPEPIEVTAPIPDYPPMNFRYKGQLHIIQKADGPERIEDEWWLQACRHRDYYIVEDQEGSRYWLFRSGHYAEDSSARWYIHGFF